MYFLVRECELCTRNILNKKVRQGNDTKQGWFLISLNLSRRLLRNIFKQKAGVTSYIIAFILTAVPIHPVLILLPKIRSWVTSNRGRKVRFYNLYYCLYGLRSIEYFKSQQQMRCFARSAVSRSLVHKKFFAFIWEVVFKLEYLSLLRR